MTYCLVTPAKDEEEMLPKTIEAVVNQTIKPSLWVMLDDGSTDSTHKIIKSACEKHSYIRLIRLAEGKREPGIHIAEVCQDGFQYINTFQGNCSFIGVLDADTVITEDYFEQLIQKFKENPKLGIASGSAYILDKRENTKLHVMSSYHPINSGRLFRQECLNEIISSLTVHTWDTVANVKAELRGWETRQYPEIMAIQLRLPSGYGGVWRGHRRSGYHAYYLNQHPLLVVAKVVKKALIDRLPIGAIAIIYGYTKSWITREEKIPDDEVREYFWNFNKKRLLTDVKRMLFHRKEEGN